MFPQLSPASLQKRLNLPVAQSSVLYQVHVLLQMEHGIHHLHFGYKQMHAVEFHHLSIQLSEEEANRISFFSRCRDELQKKFRDVFLCQLLPENNKLHLWNFFPQASPAFAFDEYGMECGLRNQKSSLIFSNLCEF